MANNRKRLLLGVTLMTPALTAAGEPRSTLVSTASAVQSHGGVGSAEAEAALKAAMLEIGVAEKLQIAGNRVPLMQLSEAATRTPAVKDVGGIKGPGAIGQRTDNIQLPECQRTPDRMGGGGGAKAGGATKGLKADSFRTNTDIPECRAPGARSKTGGATKGPKVDRTNTDIPECRAPGARTGGAAKGPKADSRRTNTNIPECWSPGARSGTGGATKGSKAPRTNTDIPECYAPYR